MKKEYFKYIIYGLAIFAVLLLISVSEKARVAMFVSVFIFVNMVITSYKKFINIPIEVEVLTLGIVFCTLNFGIKAGLVVAILGGILSFFIGLDFSAFAFPMLFGYVLMVFIAYFLMQFNITIVGIIATLINNLLIFSLYHFIFRYDLMKNLRFSLSNLIINFVLFYNIAPMLVKLV